MKKLFPLLVLLAFASPSFSQGSFKPGYLLLQGDTLRGLVKQKGDQRTTTEVEFKKSGKAAAETFGPDDISGYGFIEGYKYEKKRLGVGDTSQVQFLNLLVKGHASLYHFRDSKTKDRYYLEQGDSLQELVFYKTTEIISGKRVAVPYNMYRGTLIEAFKDCPAMVPYLKELPFTERDLITATVRYNECRTPPSLTYIEEPKKAVITWGITVGGANTKLELNRYPDYPESDYTLTANKSFLAGAMVSSTLPWANRNLSIQLEVLYNQNKYSRSITEQVFSLRKEYDAEIDIHYIKLPLQARYTFATGKVRPLIQGGLIGSFAIKNKQEITVSTINERNEVEYVSARPFVHYFRKNTPGFVVGSGLLLPAWSKHVISLEGRYEKSNSITGSRAYTVTTEQVSVLLNFRFK